MRSFNFYLKYIKGYLMYQEVIFNCGTPTERVSEYLDFLPKPVVQESWSYIKETRDFLSRN